ncbi:MAG: TetR/AcrR family transcriptional regulator [Desulfobacteraceae bacterium]|nr:TetR/AcrR family transcriptional regulator [Desulfobacteraceae bacterium]
MPPKQSITKEMIIDAAFFLVREKGISQLSARNIAKQLGCSTQPVYSCFSAMKDLENAVVEKAADHIENNYLASGEDSDNNFKSIGLGYIQLAKKEKYLFDLLYLSGRIELDFENDKFPIDSDRLIGVMKKDEYFSTFTNQELLKLLKHMWIYAHGLTALARSNPAISDEFIVNSLEEMGATVVIQALQTKGAKTNETDRP